MPARARRDVTWRGYRIPAGRRVLLDLYGTNRDPRRWERPDEFRPERFREIEVGPFDMVPQGGDGYRGRHHCPGEWATVALTRTAVRVLTTAIRYELAPQDLRLRRSGSRRCRAAGWC